MIDVLRQSQLTAVLIAIVVVFAAGILITSDSVAQSPPAIASFGYSDARRRHRDRVLGCRERGDKVPRHV